MVKGTEDVVTIRFYDRGTEVKDSALIGIVGMDVRGSLPMIYRQGYSSKWVESGTENKVSELPKTYDKNRSYEIEWEAIAYTISSGITYDGGFIHLDLTAKRTEGDEDVRDAHILLVSMYDHNITINSYSVKLDMSGGEAQARFSISQDHLVVAYAFLVSGTPTVGAFMNYGMYAFNPEG